MALLNNPLLDFKRNRQFQSLIDVLQESIPENALLQGKLSDLTSSKGSYIKQLITEWNERSHPDYNEEEIRQMNINHVAELTEQEARLEVRHETRATVTSKDWVLKERDIWKGFDPSTGRYFLKPIVFGGKIDWDNNFLPLVINDQASSFINLIQTLKGFIKKVLQWDEVTVTGLKLF